MAEPNEGRPSGSGESMSGAQAEKVSSWGFKLPSALHTIAVSVGLAAFTAISSFIGMAFAAGRKQALCLDALTSDPIDQRHVFVGLTMIAQVLVDVLLVVVFSRLAFLAVRSAGRLVARRTGLQIQVKVPIFVKRHLWLLALLVVTTDAVVMLDSMKDLSNHVNGILFKGFIDIGGFWTQAIFDKDFDTAGSYSFAYAGLLALFIWLCWWLIREGVGRPLRRAVISIFGLLVVLVSVLMYSYLNGAIATVMEYPVVSFTNQIELFGQGSVPILLGQDDKMFAFLIVLTGAKPEDEVHKM